MHRLVEGRGQLAGDLLLLAGVLVAEEHAAHLIDEELERELVEQHEAQLGEAAAAEHEVELEGASRALGSRITFSREARERFVSFARSKEAVWSGNFRDFNASVTRMATLAQGGRIGAALVEEEIARLREVWRRPGSSAEAGGPDEDVVERALGRERAASVDPFDRVQLAEVIRVCRGSRSLSEAGRSLFAASRGRKSSVNDADRLRKYLAKFELDWSAVTGG